VPTISAFVEDAFELDEEETRKAILALIVAKILDNAGFSYSSDHSAEMTFSAT
jgi:hypothetical protein